MTSNILVATILATVCCVSQTFAGSIPSSVNVTVDIEGFADIIPGGPVEAQSMPGPLVVPVDSGTGDFSQSFADNPPNVFPAPPNPPISPAPGSPSSPIWNVESLTVSGNIDPIVILNGSITNVAAVPATLVFTAVLPTGPVGPFTRFSGSIGATVTDNNGDGAVLSVSPLPGFGPTIYEGSFDGTTVLSILGDGDPVLPLVAVPPNSSAATSDDAGLGISGPTIPGPPIAATQELQVAFELTPGDSASFTAIFRSEVSLTEFDIPEPATGTMLVLAGLMSIAGCGRSRC